MECSTDEGHIPERSGHLSRFWHFHIILNFYFLVVVPSATQHTKFLTSFMFKALAMAICPIIAHILGILLMNSCNTDIFFSNCYHLQSVRFDLFILWVSARPRAWRGMWICVRSKDAQKQLARMSLSHHLTKGAFVCDQFGIRIIGIMQVSVCLGAILIPEYLDFHSGYSASRNRIAGMYSKNIFLFRNIPSERP